MTGPLIAVVEDDPAIALFLEDLLAEEGYTTRIWTDSQGVFEFCRDEQPNLVVLDLWLQHRNEGWLLFERLCDDSVTTHIPVIICSGDMRSIDQRLPLLQADHWRVLAKPFDLEEMVTQVRTLLAAPGATRVLSTLLFALATYMLALGTLPPPA